jgi:hypothetical protein
MLRKVADPIADLRRAVAGFRPGQVTASEAAAIVVKAGSEIVEATKVINGDLESYVRFVVSGSAPIRRQPTPVTLVETLAPTPTTLPELPSVPLFQGAAA